MCKNSNMDCDSHIQAIEDFVFNEGKIVTYKWLSSELNIHINSAKQLLYAFTKKTHDNESLVVTYVISGFPLDSNGLNVMLIKEENLNKAKKHFKQVVSEHVYSVQNGKSLRSLNDIYIADIDAKKPNEKFRTIHIDGDILRNDAGTTNEVVNSSNSDKKGSGKRSFDKNIKESNQGNAPKKQVSENKTSISHVKDSLQKNKTKEKTSPKKTPKVAENNAGSANSNSKTKEASPKKNDKKGAKKNGLTSKGSGIGAFFSRQAEKNEKKRNEESLKKTTPEKSEVTDLNKNKDLDADNKSKESSRNEPRSLKNKENHKQKGKKSYTKRKNTAEDDHSSKRRKRIVLMSDSESSEEEMDVDEEPEPPSPHLLPLIKPENDDEVIPPTPSEKGHKRVRKQIDRTFTDEEGFIVTKKEYVYESCSDEETETSSNKIQEKTPIPEKPKKGSPKSNSPQKNKQSTLMSFFKKK